MSLEIQLAEVQRILKASHLKISCAESLTTGHVQTMLGQISGSSQCFAGGITAYNIDQKVKHLGVCRAIAETCDCVCESTAAAMAVGAAALFNTEVSIATTGFAEFSNARKPFAFYAIYIKVLPRRPVLIVNRVKGPHKNRIEMQRFVAEEAITKLYDELKKFYRRK